MLKKVLFAVCLIPGLIFSLQGQPSGAQWADSVFNTLSTDEKIGQLFMVPVYPRTGEDYMDKIGQAVKSHRVGGLIFMEGGPVQLAHIRNRMQNEADVPLLIAVDAAWGLDKKIDSTLAFPRALMLGAVRYDSLIYAMGREIARQLKELGIHINFAPSADIISLKKYDSAWGSFGESKVNVADKAVAYMRGMQDQGILACAKHFPVQGLTIVDIGKDGLPVLNAYIDSVALYPYAKLFHHKISGVLPASSDFPLFYEKKKVIKKNKFTPALLSSIYAGDWLRKNMSYEGLVFVSIPDIMDSNGGYKNGEAEMLAFQAGNDVILFPDDIGPAIRRIKRLLRRDERYEAQLNNTVKRILAAKYKAGLHARQQIVTDNLYQRLHTKEAFILTQRLLENAVTVVRNEEDILPVKILEDRKIATLSVAGAVANALTAYTSRYAEARHFSWSEGQDPDSLYHALEGYGTIIAGLFGEPTEAVLNLLESLQADRQVIICLFDTPLQLERLEKFNTILLSYTADEAVVKIAAQSVFGALPARGRLPLTVSDAFRVGQGRDVGSLGRLSFSIPEDAGMDSEVLEKIESIAREAIELKATPGCQVLVAKDGKIVYDRSFGYHTYDSAIAVTDKTLYDLASVTKVSATLQTVMFMAERGLIDVNRKASYYLPELKRSNKKDFTIKDILTHQAGLWPFLPFWAQTMKDSVLMPAFYDTMLTAKYPLMVTEKLYATRAMRDSLWQWIIRARVRDKVPRTPYDYRYSDMGFYILQRLAEKILNQPMEGFLKQNLYDPLGAYTMGYLPLQRFAGIRIAPTEDDRLFRRQLLVGTVHDQGAAMLGGVAGHAGLFSSANDLAKLGQMLLQEGYYGGTRYYRPETVRLFTARQFETSRRGLGWDKPVQSEWNSPTSAYASPRTFGHTGFTGTCLWVDPEFNLVYVFLSNRVHPDMTNTKLLVTNIRSRIQDTLYQAIFSYCSHHTGVTAPEPVAASVR